jgi:muramoyltetrapeptide carboxypeptidase
MIRVGIVGTSSVLPKIEFEAGVEFLKSQGFSVEVHPSVLGRDFLYTASDEVRAQALIEFSSRSDLDVIWFGRGGYGATHLLPLLNQWKKSLRGKRLRKKTLIGFSDLTAILEWYRVNFGWETIHGPMPSLRTFPVLPKTEWNLLLNLIQASLKLERLKTETYQLEPIYVPKKFTEATGPLVGGNLTVWGSLLGTPDQGSTRGRFLFLEDVQENLGRINRTVHQLEQAGGLKGCKGIVLGDFTDCTDSVPTGLSRAPLSSESKEAFLSAPPKEAMQFLRSRHTPEEGLRLIFETLGHRQNLPVFSGLPAGHGARHHSLYLGKPHSLKKTGRFGLSF